MLEIESPNFCPFCLRAFLSAVHLGRHLKISGCVIAHKATLNRREIIKK